VRGLSPWPGAHTFFGEERWNLWKTIPTLEATTDKPGTIVALDKQSIQVATGEGMLKLREIQTANSKRMPVSQFLTGHKVAVGMQLGLRDV
jgi:methionyl-tRNA formyltransferase